MTQTPPRSTGALWARFRFSVVGSLLSSPPARSAQDSHPRPCRQDLVSSRERTRRPFLGRHHRAVVLHSTAPARRPGRRLAPRRAQRLRQGVPGRGCGRAAFSPVPRPPALELPTALRQPRRFGEGRSFAGAAPLLFHGPAVHAGSRLGAQAEASAEGTPRRSSRGKEAPDARDPQLRSRVRRGSVAPAVHRETSSSPVERFAQNADVLRSSPSSESLRDTFRLESKRSRRQSDGTISLGACAFRFRAGIVTFAKWPCVTPAGTSAESIWSTSTVELFGSPFILSTAAPTPTAAAPLLSPMLSTCRPTKASARTASCRRF